MIIEFLQQLSFGKHLMFIPEFIGENVYLVGAIGFLYGCVLFYGAYCAKNKIPEIFNSFVLEESTNMLKEDPSISESKLTDAIYEKWINYVPTIPSKYKIVSKKGFWITNPTIELLENSVGINKDSVKLIFVKART